MWDKKLYLPIHAWFLFLITTVGFTQPNDFVKESHLSPHIINIGPINSRCSVFADFFFFCRRQLYGKSTHLLIFKNIFCPLHIISKIFNRKCSNQCHLILSWLVFAKWPIHGCHSFSSSLISCITKSERPCAFQLPVKSEHGSGNDVAPEMTVFQLTQLQPYII